MDVNQLRKYKGETKNDYIVIIADELKSYILYIL